MDQKSASVDANTPQGAVAAKSLEQLLGQSEQIQSAVDECAEQLSVVNDSLRDELDAQPAQPGVANALEMSESVEEKVQSCAADLGVVNLALEEAVRERQQLEVQLAEVTRQQASAEHAAFHDALTGLPNRALFNDRLAHALAQAQRYGWTLAVMFIDLDRFKAINDQHGHAAGDAVLLATAERLKRLSRDADTVSRHGGDEFLCLLLELQSAANAETIATLSQPCIVNTGELELALSIKPSIGIAIYPQHGNTAEALVHSADEAMYWAKRAGQGFLFAV